jgi:glucose-1-phosphate adenylyltransferase
VLLDGVDVGGGAKLLRAVVDENVHIPPGAVIGYNLEEDRKHFCVSDGGVIVITRTDFAPTPVGTVALAPVG